MQERARRADRHGLQRDPVILRAHRPAVGGQVDLEIVGRRGRHAIAELHAVGVRQLLLDLAAEVHVEHRAIAASRRVAILRVQVQDQHRAPVRLGGIVELAAHDRVRIVDHRVDVALQRRRRFRRFEHQRPVKRVVLQLRAEAAVTLEQCRRIVRAERQRAPAQHRAATSACRARQARAARVSGCLHSCAPTGCAMVAHMCHRIRLAAAQHACERAVIGSVSPAPATARP